MAPSGHPRLGRLTGRSHSLPHCTDLTLQNILKRTAQGSEDEDMATKAFNALKEVSLAGQGVSGSQGPPPDPLGTSKGTPAFRVSGSPVGTRGWALGARVGEAACDPPVASPAGARVQRQRAVHEEDRGAHPPEQEDPL